MPLPDFLIDRYIDWKKNYFEQNKKLFEKSVEEGQKPIAMIISCCDSRIHATSIFGANIGEFFIHRNIANLVPPYKPDGDHYGTYAAIEYAVKTLKVAHIIILGHSNCGGIDHAYKSNTEKIEKKYEFIDQWLKVLNPAFKNLDTAKTHNDKIKLLEKESIKNSLKNLRNFPFIDDLINKEKINIHGLWHDIATGVLLNYNFDKNIFEKINYK